MWGMDDELAKGYRESVESQEYDILQRVLAQSGEFDLSDPIPGSPQTWNHMLNLPEFKFIMEECKKMLADVIGTLGTGEGVEVFRSQGAYKILVSIIEKPQAILQDKRKKELQDAEAARLEREQAGYDDDESEQAGEQ